MVAISGMVATGIATASAAPTIAIPLGAILFAASDLSVARERFVEPSPWNGTWGLPTYYAAVLLIAASVPPP